MRLRLYIVPVVAIAAFAAYAPCQNAPAPPPNSAPTVVIVPSTTPSTPVTTSPDATSKPANTHFEFEVATVKPAAPLDFQRLAADVKAGKMPRLGPHVDAARAEYTYMSLKELIVTAYGVKAYQIEGPSWLAEARFDIQATLPEGATKDDAPAMLQKLLGDRFKLVVHRDNAEHKVLALVVGKDGPKLKESPAAPQDIDPNAPLQPGETNLETEDGPIRMMRKPDGTMVMNMGKRGTMTMKLDMSTQSMNLQSSMVTMDGFADMLTNMMQMGGSGGPQVVNMTGLKGNYEVAVDISLTAIMAMARAQGAELGGAPGGGGATQSNAPANAASDPQGGQTVYSSVEKLGLKLEERKATVERLVVDHAEKTPIED
ncbi:MAG: TIGR03435 family protein [Terracidiphilus sp.]